MYTYKVIFFTGSLSWSGTNANIDLTLYGTEGESQMLLFKNRGNTTFESGMRNQFTVNVKRHLGTLYRVRVGHDNIGLMPAWFLERILIKEESTGVYYEFNCYKWFDSATGDLRIRRFIRSTRDFVQHDAEHMIQQEEIVIGESVVEEPEMVPEPELPEEVLESVPEPEVQANEELLESAPIEFPDDPEEPQQTDFKYTITFYTGTVAFAGTDANVYASIHGTDEQTTEEYMFVNRGNQTFEKGAKNSYPIDSKIPFDSVSKLNVMHDNRGIFPGWYLATVELEDSTTGKKMTFPCNRWLWSIHIFSSLATKCELTRQDAIVDGPPVEIPSSPSTEKAMNDAISASSQSPSNYTIHLVSEVSYGSLSEDKIVFTLYGKNGQSEEKMFDQQENVVFEKRMRGTMQLECPNYLGSIEKIKIGLDSSNGQMPWILVVVIDNKSNDTTVFMCDCCLLGEKNAQAKHDHLPVFAGAVHDVLALDRDHGNEWTLVKGVKDAVVWTRDDASPKRPPIIKANLTLDDVPCPYRTAVKHFTDWEERKRWDKTFEAVKVLEKIGDFTLVQCTLKLPFYATNREMVLACLDRSDQRYHVQAMRNALHPRVLFNNKQIRAESLKSGTVVHKLDLNDNNPATVTVISQIELGGWLQSRVKNSYLAEIPVKQVEYLKTYLTQRKPSIKRGEERNSLINQTKTKHWDEEHGNKLEFGVLKETKREQESQPHSNGLRNQNGPTAEQKADDAGRKFQELNFDTTDGKKEQEKFVEEIKPYESKQTRISFVRSKNQNGIVSELDSRNERKDEQNSVDETESLQRSSGSIFSRHFSWKFNSSENRKESSFNSQNSRKEEQKIVEESQSVSSSSDSKNARNSSSMRANAKNGKAQENFNKMNAADQDFQKEDQSSNRFFRDIKLIQWLKMR